MKIFNNFNCKLPSNTAAIGFFDGMHIAHQAVIAKSTELGGGILTFKNHPKAELGENIPLLFSYKNRLSAFKKLGAKFVVALDFNEVKNITALEFLTILKKNGIDIIISGEDARIGCDRQKISEICKKSPIKHILVPIIYQNGEKISSTNLRKIK